MKEIADFLKEIKELGLPDNLLQKLTDKIEARYLRISEHEDDIRRAAAKRAELNGTPEDNTVLLFCLAILLGNEDDDELNFSAIFLAFAPKKSIFKPK